jgi:hypothetical protein
MCPTGSGRCPFRSGCGGCCSGTWGYSRTSSLSSCARCSPRSGGGHGGKAYEAAARTERMKQKGPREDCAEWLRRTLDLRQRGVEGLSTTHRSLHWFSTRLEPDPVHGPPRPLCSSTHLQPASHFSYALIPIRLENRTDAPQHWCQAVLSHRAKHLAGSIDYGERLTNQRGTL